MRGSPFAKDQLSDARRPSTLSQRPSSTTAAAECATKKTASKKLAPLKSYLVLGGSAPFEWCSPPPPAGSQAPLQQYSKRQHASAAAATLHTVAIGHPVAATARAAWWAHYLRAVAVTPACCAYRTREIHRHTYCVWLCVEYPL